MVWLAFALLANFLYSVSNIADQFLRRKHVKHDASFIVILMGFFFLLWLAAVPFIRVSVPPLPQLLAVLTSGFIVMFMVAIYVYAISREEISRIMPVLQFHSVFVLVLSAVFLGEKLQALSYVGFAVMLIAGLLLTVERIEASFRINQTLLMVVGASVVLAISLVLLKFFYLTGDFWNGFFWFYLGGFVWTAIFAAFPSHLRTVKAHLRELNCKIVAIFVLAAVSGFFADLSWLLAAKLGPVSLVSVVGSTQIAMLFVMTLLLTLYFPRILKERLDRKVLLTKLAAIALMVAGLLLLG